MRVSKLLLAALALPAPMLSAQPADSEFVWSGYVGIASDQVYRGVSLAEDTLVPNLNAVIEHRSGLYLQGWLTRVDLAGLIYQPEQSTQQLQVDAGYRYRIDPDWTLSLAHNWYLYSGKVNGVSRDYREWAVTLDYNAYLTVGYADSDDLWNSGTEQEVVTASARWPFVPGLIGEATIGRVTQSYRYRYYDDSYRFVSLRLGYVVRDWSLQLQYHDTYGANLPYDHDRLGQHWVVAGNWHW